MSRTYKDRPWKVRFPDSRWLRKDDFYNIIECERTFVDWFTKEPFTRTVKIWLDKPGVLKKKKKRENTEYPYNGGPSWFRNQFMTRPERHAANRACRVLSDVEEVDIPDTRRKPHIYWD